ncbi:MAG TPA: efflux RND transporter periplasmic adaptor subunit [Ignavibacteriaceae bacterium]|jgi:RND family efflux transporter MFP subunit|nr:efflux RND transporter periplasmic adaptor subunit [Ignavibacteriaceae bacterium]
METSKADLSSLRIDRSGNHNPDSSRKKIIIIVVIIAAAILLFLGYSIAGSLFNSAIEVKLTSAVIQSPSQTSTSLTASGYVVAQRKASVASKGTGRLEFLGAVEGDRVKKDQVLGRLEDNDIRAQLEEAKANLKLAEADLNDAKNNYNRQTALLKSGATTQMEVDAAEAQYNRVLASIEVAKANLNSAQVALENTLIRAPFDGTVLTKNAEVGEIVAPLGASSTSRGAIVTMADMKSLQVEADVSESYIERIKTGQGCEIILDAYPQVSYEGFVDKIVPTADRSKATVLVKVGFKNYDSKVLPEMSAKVLFLSRESTNEEKNEPPVLVVPVKSVVTRDGHDVVFMVKDDKAVEVPVVKGRDLDSYIEIKSGLTEGDKVIDGVSEEIKDGTKIKIL